jgi:hypothetical protein
VFSPEYSEPGVPANSYKWLMRLAR